jgi:hypothetical protein
VCGAFWQAAQRISTAIFKYQSDGFRQVSSR